MRSRFPRTAAGRRPRYDNPREYRKIGKTEITLTFPAEKLFDWFDLPTNDQIFENVSTSSWDYGQVDLADTICLGVSIADDDELGEVLVDLNDQPITEEAEEALRYAAQDATQFGTERNILDNRDEALRRGLEAFSDFDYEYAYTGASGAVAHASGVAKGITDVEIVHGDTVKVTMNTDIVHAINACIDGYGEFAVVEDFIGAFSEKQTLEDFIRGHFYWLSYYWEIYGGSKPRMDYDNVEDFDQAYFKEEVQKVEQQYGLKLWSCR